MPTWRRRKRASWSSSRAPRSVPATRMLPAVGRSSPETWLYRIVTNGSIDALRKRARRKLTSDEAVDPGFDGVASAEARLALVEIEDWLGQLPPDQRATVTLKALEGLTSSEVAKIMECSEGAVEQRLVRARATLRKLREGSHDEN